MGIWSLSINNVDLHKAEGLEVWKLKAHHKNFHWKSCIKIRKQKKDQKSARKQLASNSHATIWLLTCDVRSKEFLCAPPDPHVWVTKVGQRKPWERRPGLPAPSTCLFLGKSLFLSQASWEAASFSGSWNLCSLQSPVCKTVLLKAYLSIPEGCLSFWTLPALTVLYLFCPIKGRPKWGRQGTMVCL